MYHEGSFNWYRNMGGHFVKAMAEAIMRADSCNREKIRKIFPQMVAAYDGMWDWVPDGFTAPEYNAEKIEGSLK